MWEDIWGPGPWFGITLPMLEVRASQQAAACAGQRLIELHTRAIPSLGGLLGSWIYYVSQGKRLYYGLPPEFVGRDIRVGNRRKAAGDSRRLFFLLQSIQKRSGKSGQRVSRIQTVGTKRQVVNNGNSGNCYQLLGLAQLQRQAATRIK